MTEVSAWYVDLFYNPKQEFPYEARLYEGETLRDHNTFDTEKKALRWAARIKNEILRSREYGRKRVVL